MPEVKLPFGLRTFTLCSDEEALAFAELARKRAEFALAYMKEKGWGSNPDTISIEELMEIRDQPGWKDPT
jgi:hypothetical protein